MEDDPSIVNKSIDLQFLQLILEPMQIVEQFESKVVIIDGLDECEDSDIQAYIIQLIGRACDQKLPVCFLIASRPEPHIQDVFDAPFIRRHCRRLVLDESFSPDHDIRVFLQSSFAEIRDKHRRIMQSVPTTWPSYADISTLVDRSSGQFIYAATVVKFVGERGHRPTERLKIILDMSPPAKASGAFAELDRLYSQILSFSADIALTLRVLGARAALPSTLSYGVSFLEDLLLLQRGDVYLALSSLHSLLRVPDPEQHHQNITVYHKSFFDFLFDSQRSKVFFIDINASHAGLARRCLCTLTNALKDEGQIGTKPMLPTTVSYAYCHWCFHCTKANRDSELLEDLHRVDIIGLDSRRIFPKAAVTFLLDFPGVIDWLTIDVSNPSDLFADLTPSCPQSSLKAKAIYQTWSSTLDGYFTECLNKSSHQDDMSFMLGIWLLKLQQPRKAFLDPQFGSSLCPLQKGFFSSRIFLEYLRDPLRSGKYNINPTIYARITCRVLEILNTNPPCFGNPIFLNNFEEWTSCLTQSAPTTELLSALQLKPANAWVTYLLTKGSNFQVVLDWLEVCERRSIPNIDSNSHPEN